MVLTAKQEEGLKIALERWKLGEKYTCIAGYAGSGKSTLIKFIISAMNLNPEEVRYIAYTGKAANVLKNKGCQGAMTAHKLLYRARLMPNGTYKFLPRSREEIREEQIKVVVVDEVSMLPKKIWDLLCQNDFYILACGDPEQLPPIADVKGEDPNNHVLDHPHIFLDEIMRQAQESEIIRLSMHIRENKPIFIFPVKNEEVMIFKKEDMTDSMLAWADQILCATKFTKNNLNNRVRTFYGFPKTPQVGDKIINLHNEWETLSTNNNPLTNGIIGTICEDFEVKDYEYSGYVNTGKYSGPSFKIPILYIIMTGDEENEKFYDLSIDYNELLTGNPSLTGEQQYRIMRTKTLINPLHFNYGYAITVWKAQGSEWDKVLLLSEPSWPRDPDLCRKYLYTGVTRASKKLVLVT